MRRLAPAAVLLVLPLAMARAAGDLPLVVIGQSFSPSTPTPVRPDHPLYHRVALAEIDDLPPAVGRTLVGVISSATRSSVNEGLAETLRRMNLLAPTDADARVRLTARWAGVETPFRIGSEGRSTATLSYRLARIDSGQTLFERRIVTTAEGRGIDAGRRAINTARTAIAVNFASLSACLDKAALGKAPQDCALTPLFKVDVTRD